MATATEASPKSKRGRKPKGEKSPTEIKASRRALRSQVRHPGIVDMRGPIKLDVLRKLAPSMVETIAQVESFVKAGGPAPTYVAFPDNAFMSREEYLRLVDRWNGGENVEVPLMYQPLLVEYLNSTNAVCAYAGSVDEWDVERFGKWPTSELGAREEGNYLDAAPKQYHSPIENMAYDADGNEDIITLGRTRFALSINFAARGQYHALLSVLFESSVNDPNMVFRIDDRPVIESRLSRAAGNVAIFGAGQVAVPGHLVDESGKTLTHTQIRKLGDGKAKFVASEENELKMIDAKTFFGQVRDQLGRSGIAAIRERADEPSTSTVADRFAYNMTTMQRCSLSSLHPYGMRAVQIGIVPFSRCDAEGNTSYAMAIGRANDGLIVGSREATATVRAAAKAEKVAAKAATRAAAKEAKAAAKAAKDAKPKTVKTTKPNAAKPKKVTTKPKAAKPKTVQVATDQPTEEVSVTVSDDAEVEAATNVEAGMTD